MKKALVVRPGHAIGDAIFITALPRLLHQDGYLVDLAIEEHNRAVFLHNPYVNDVVVLPRNYNPANPAFADFTDRFEKEIKPAYDEVFHAGGHVEIKYLHRTDLMWGAVPDGPTRRQRAEGVNYYDAIMEGMGLPYRGVKPEFYFSQEEKDQLDRTRDLMQRNRHKLILWQLEGSSLSKSLTCLVEYIRQTAQKLPYSMHYCFAPSPNLRAQLPERLPNVFDMFAPQNAKQTNIRTSICLTAIAHLVVGPESFLVNAAGAFPTPKVIFFSHSAPDNLARYYENCYAVVPDKEKVPCHPCYLIHVNFRRCFHPERRAVARQYEICCQVARQDYPYEHLGYKCSFYLPHDNVLQTITNIVKKKPVIKSLQILEEKVRHAQKNRRAA